jgi:hypothetical protein
VPPPPLKYSDVFYVKLEILNKQAPPIARFCQNLVFVS